MSDGLDSAAGLPAGLRDQAAGLAMWAGLLELCSTKLGALEVRLLLVLTVMKFTYDN
jgi:hypothetical protein